MTRVELDKVERLPELTPDEQIVLVAELPPHPTILQVREKTIELLADRMA